MQYLSKDLKNAKKAAMAFNKKITKSLTKDDIKKIDAAKKELKGERQIKGDILNRRITI